MEKPPASGKTTIARLIAGVTAKAFEPLSAVSAGGRWKSQADIVQQMVPTPGRRRIVASALPGI
jgi:replication-associated recombination protein RarA